MVKVETRKISRKERNEIVRPVAKYFTNDVMEFTFKRSSFDVVSFDNNKNVWKIVECKVTNRITGVGSTFGQLIAYTGLISSNGKAFLQRLHEEKKWKIPLYTWKKMLDSKVIPVEFYVAFRRDDVRNNEQFLLWAYENFSSKKIGIILVDKGRCTILRNSEKLDIPLTSSYSKISDVLEEISNLAREKDYASNASVKIFNRYIQWYYENERIHFEIWFGKNKKFIEVALHVETTPSRNIRIHKLLRRKIPLLKRKLPNLRVEKWGQGWARAYERIYWNGKVSSIDDNLLEEIVSKMERYVDVLKPILDRNDWGRETSGPTQKQIVRRFIMRDGKKKRVVSTEQIFRHVQDVPEFSNFGNDIYVRNHATYRALLLCKEDPQHFVRIDKHTFCYDP